MVQAIISIGVLSSLCGLALIMRFGFRLQSRIGPGALTSDAEMLSAEEMRKHRDDLRGRFGFLLTVVGVLIQLVSSYWLWTQP